MLQKAVGRDEDRLTPAGWAVLRREFPDEFAHIDDTGRRLPGPDEVLATIGLRRVPVVPAQIAAGRSRQLYDAVDAAHADEFVLLEDDPTGGRRELFAVEVVGDSMIDAHILPGDTVLFRPSDTAATGDIVAALLEDGTVTVKRYERAGGEVRLWAANPTMPEPIVVPVGAGDFGDVVTIRILGVYEGLRRGAGARTVPATAWAPAPMN